MSASGTGVPKRRNAFIPAACRSQSIATPVTSITANAALTTSGPTPSPEISVTARLPEVFLETALREDFGCFFVFAIQLCLLSLSVRERMKVRVLIQHAKRAIQDSGFCPL